MKHTCILAADLAWPVFKVRRETCGDGRVLLRLIRTDGDREQTIETVTGRPDMIPAVALAAFATFATHHSR